MRQARVLSLPIAALAAVALALTSAGPALGGQPEPWQAPFRELHSDGPIYAAAVSPDGRKLATVGGLTGKHRYPVEIWNLATGERERQLLGHRAMTVTVAFSPDGQVLATSSLDKTIRLWSVRRGRLLRVLRGHLNGLIAIDFSPDGRLLAGAGYDYTVRLRRLPTGRLMRVLRQPKGPVMAVAFSPDGRWVAAASCDRTGGPMVRLWDRRTGRLKADLPAGCTFLWSLAFSADGERLAAGGEVYLPGQSEVTAIGGELRLWDLSKWDRRRTRPPPLVKAASAEIGCIRALAFSPDGKTLVAGGAPPGQLGEPMIGLLTFWDPRRGALQARSQVGPDLVTSLAFSPDAKLLVVTRFWAGVRLYDWRPPAPGAAKLLESTERLIGKLVRDRSTARRSPRPPPPNIPIRRPCP